jgi:hypothetical protein
MWMLGASPSTRYAAFGALLLGMTLVSLPVAQADGPARPGPLAGCRKYHVKDTYHIDSTGHRASESTPNSDTVREFGTDKESMKVTVPPAGFDPRTASASQLLRYGFPPRPAQPAALQRWKKMYPKGGIEYVIPDMCQATVPVTHRPHWVGQTGLGTSPLAPLPPSDNWSGGIAQQAVGNPTFTFADVRWTEPTFSASCPSMSAYSIWSGLGGTSSGANGGLLQAGVSNLGGTGPNADYAWWEALHNNPATTLPEQIITNFPVSAGDEVQSVTYYNRPDESITFQLYNLTKNKLVTLGPWNGIVDQNGNAQGTADEYYDGSTAEMIAERPTYNNSIVDLRKPTSGYSQFLDSALGNDDEGDPYPGYQFPNWRRLNMQANKSGNLLSEPTGFPTKPGNAGWKNLWHNCS